jgi:hypothetical protein
MPITIFNNAVFKIPGNGFGQFLTFPRVRAQGSGVKDRPLNPESSQNKSDDIITTITIRP